MATVPGRESALSPELVLDGGTHRGQTWSNSRLLRFSSVGATFRNCTFDQLVSSMVSFGSGRRISVYDRCTFRDCDFEVSTAGRARFESCTFDNVRIRNWRCHDVEVVRCRFTGQLRTCFFNGHSDRGGRSRKLEWHGNDFSECMLVGVDFRNGIDLRRQRLPTGPDYLLFLQPRLTYASLLAHLADNPDSPHARSLRSVAELMELSLRGGQEHLFYDRTVVRGRDREAVWGLLVRLHALHEPE